MRKNTALFSLFIFITVLVSAQAPAESVLKRKAPQTFRAVFKTNKGEFRIEANRDWSPLGVDRLYQLITTGYFTNNLIFRVEPAYVVQFGVAETHPVKIFWDRRKIKDEPVKQKNTKGMIGFARDVKDSRAAQIFINMVDNPKLDTIVREGVTGYPPVARIISGMEVVAKFNAEYGKRPTIIQDSLYKYGNAHFNMLFPRLDRILSASILP